MDPKVEFVRNIIRASRADTLPAGASTPEIFLDATVAQPRYTEIGLQLLRDSKVAVLMVAGGVSTRMGGEILRGNLPIGPVTSRSIFRLQGEKIAAIKKRFSPQMPWLVMTSVAIHDAIVLSFRQENFYGVLPEDVWFFQQDSLPVLDAHQNPIRLADGAYLESPAGHGGMLDALSVSGSLQRLRERGIEYLFYFQYPNVLERVCDPVMLGYHCLEGFEATTKVVGEYQPEEKIGRCISVNKTLRIVEYHHLKEAPLDDWWHTVPANIGTHIWSVSFIERCVKEGVQLPFHVAPHNIAIGAPKPLHKVEQFVFDLLDYAVTAGIITVARDEEYAPVKNSTGPGSLESGRKALSRLYRGWLSRAGAVSAVVEETDCLVEISPFYALNADDLRKKLPPGFRYTDGLVLQCPT